MKRMTAPAMSVPAPLVSAPSGVGKGCVFEYSTPPAISRDRPGIEDLQKLEFMTNINVSIISGMANFFLASPRVIF